MNPGSDHAEAALVFVYGTATKSIKIFCEDMNSSKIPSQSLLDNWWEVVRNPDIKVEVIAEVPDKDSPRLNILREYNDSEYSNALYSLDTEAYNNALLKIKGNQPFHYTIADGRVYRFEFDTVNHKAYLNFNDTNIYNRLNLMFNDLKSKDGNLLDNQNVRSVSA